MEGKVHTMDKAEVMQKRNISFFKKHHSSLGKRCAFTLDHDFAQACHSVNRIALRAPVSQGKRLEGSPILAMCSNRSAHEAPSDGCNKLWVSLDFDVDQT